MDRRLLSVGSSELGLLYRCMGCRDWEVHSLFFKYTIERTRPDPKGGLVFNMSSTTARILAALQIQKRELRQQNQRLRALPFAACGLQIPGLGCRWSSGGGRSGWSSAAQSGQRIMSALEAPNMMWECTGRLWKPPAALVITFSEDHILALRPQTE